MDKYDFICMVDDIFDECETKEQMDSRLKEMKNIIQQQYVLKVGFKSTMGELKQNFANENSISFWEGD